MFFIFSVAISKMNCFCIIFVRVVTLQPIIYFKGNEPILLSSAHISLCKYIPVSVLTTCGLNLTEREGNPDIADFFRNLLS